MLKLVHVSNCNVKVSWAIPGPGKWLRLHVLRRRKVSQIQSQLGRVGPLNYTSNPFNSGYAVTEFNNDSE